MILTHAALTVPLDPALSAAQNARNDMRSHRKAQTAEQIASTRSSRVKRNCSISTRCLTRFRASSRGTQRTAGGTGRRPICASSVEEQKPPLPLGPLEFVSDDGFRILESGATACRTTG